MTSVDSGRNQILPSHEPLLRYRFAELKVFHGIEDEKPLVGAAGPQKMASGLLCRNFKLFFIYLKLASFKDYQSNLQFCSAITLKCVGASIGEKPSLTKKLPGATTVIVPLSFSKLQVLLDVS